MQDCASRYASGSLHTFELIHTFMTKVRYIIPPWVHFYKLFYSVKMWVFCMTCSLHNNTFILTNTWYLVTHLLRCWTPIRTFCLQQVWTLWFNKTLSCLSFVCLTFFLLKVCFLKEFRSMPKQNGSPSDMLNSWPSMWAHIQRFYLFHVPTLPK